jgi:hypothetical protein
VGNFLRSSGRFSFSGRTLLHGVSKSEIQINTGLLALRVSTTPPLRKNTTCNAPNRQNVTVDSVLLVASGTTEKLTIKKKREIGAIMTHVKLSTV